MADGSAAIRVFFFNPKVLSFFFEKMKVNFFLNLLMNSNYFNEDRRGLLASERPCF